MIPMFSVLGSRFSVLSSQFSVGGNPFHAEARRRGEETAEKGRDIEPLLRVSASPRELIPMRSADGERFIYDIEANER
jgi:hypothetical protein